MIKQSDKPMARETQPWLALAMVATLCLRIYVPTWSDSLPALREDLAGWMAHPALHQADVGAEVLSLPEDTALYSLNSHKTFIPASTVKLVVTATALELLGANFVFHTLLWMQQPPDNSGLVAGDVIIGGTADPNAPGNLYSLLARKLKAGGMKQIKGDIVGAAPVRASDKDNGLNAARALRIALHRAGVIVEGQAVAHPLPYEAFLIYQHKSTPLSNYMKAVNKYSDNHRAQQLLTSLATQFGDPFDGQHRFISEVWRQRDLYVEGLCVLEGSGLSARNQLSPAFVADLLVQMTSRDDTFKVLRDSLPIAGVDGTLRHRMGGTAAEGRVYAKTGTLRGVSCLSGYVLVAGEAKVAFSMMMNNYSCSLSKARRIQDQMAARIAEYALAQHAGPLPVATKGY